MKLISEGIIVRCHTAPYSGNGGAHLRATESTVPHQLQPHTVIWQGRMYRVRAIMMTWRWRGSWWTTPALAGQERTYFRVMCAPPGSGATAQQGAGAGVSDRTNGNELCMELYCERGRWTLSRLLD